ncbi:MAG: GNAT family N-acetyltransferase [Rhodococcus sp. (in: high G+C Gram-positive bacteria)]|uniref:GNAT family N-acetyltransferase n=1 Tax=Rhodococcus sp. TaxID=1831 RepID=UPI003BAFB4EA
MEPKVRDNLDGHRYEIVVDGVVAGFVDYSLKGSTLTLIHTEIDDAFEGKGYAGQLVGRTLDAVARRGLSIDPQCSYVQGFLRKYPDYQSLVADGAAHGTTE